jgi:DNA-binding protein HU-beta
MNKAELIAALAAECDMSKTDTEKFLNGFQKVVTHTLQKGGEISLIGFMSMKTMLKKASEGRNPKTGEKIKIPAKKRVKMKAGKLLNDAVN